MGYLFLGLISFGYLSLAWTSVLRAPSYTLWKGGPGWEVWVLLFGGLNIIPSEGKGQLP